MHAFEQIVVAYALALGLVAIARRAWLAALAALLLTAVVSFVAWAGAESLRILAPNLYLACGYWIPALLVRRPSGASRFERWLMESDDYWRPRLPGVPASVAHLSELAYLACYPLVPLAMWIVWQWGDGGDVTRYWTTILLAGYGCYVSLPWLVSRPPRPSVTGRSPLGRINSLVLSRVSHSWTTFPSGHVAVACAAAMAVARVSPAAGAAIGIMAVGVAVGAAAGRYHYVIDVVAGIAVALVAVVIT